MDVAIPSQVHRTQRWLPYWAVLSMDMHQLSRSWVFRLWFLSALTVSLGLLLHRAAIHHQAGIVQTAGQLMSELLQFSLLIGISLVIFLSAGVISAERGVIADSVLSRGISRYQYFFGKWHARLALILGSIFFICLLTFLGSCFLLRTDDISWLGTLMALLLVLAVLAIAITAGVTVSAMCQSTALSIAIVWIVMHGIGAILYMLEFGLLNPGRLMRLIPAILRGYYDLPSHGSLLGYCLLLSFVVAIMGCISFSRCDV